MHKMRSWFVLILAAGLIAGSLAAQQPTGKIIGKITDSEGTPLPGVAVEASSARLVGKATAVSDAAGLYRLLALPPGNYTIQYTLAGFNTVARKDIILEMEKTLTVDVSLVPGKIEEQVTVVGKSPIIDVKNTTRGTTMNRQVFTVLPKGRNFDSLLVTFPGVSQETLLAGTSVDGASGAENMYFVDGINTNNLISGVSAQQVNYDFVEEVQFKSSGYNAEFGGSLGGVVNVLTRSGGNEFHGELMAYFQDEKLVGRRRDILNFNYADRTKASMYAWDDFQGKDRWSNLEGGFNLGGYLIKDRIWFFGSLMPNYGTWNRNLDYSVQNLNLTREITSKQYTWNAQAKISAQPFKNLRLGASLINNLSVVRGPGGRGAVAGEIGGMPSSWNASSTTDYNALGFNYPNFSASATADLIASSNFLINVRGGYFRTNQNHQLPRPASSPIYVFQMEQPYSYAPTTNDLAQWPEIPAGLRHGTSWQNEPLTKLFDTKQVIREKANFNLDLNYYLNLAGEHAFKLGGQFIRQGENVDNSAVVPLVYLAWDQSFEAYGTNYGRGRYGWYAVRGNDASGLYGSLYNAYSNQYAFYVQDTWTVFKKLTLNLGVRTESEYIPSYSQEPIYKDLKPVRFDFLDKISPRLGFVFDVFGDSSLKLYGNFAIYQDVMKLDMAANALGGFKWKSAYYSLDDWDYTKIGVNDYYPGTSYAVFDHRTPAFETVDPDMKPFTQREIAFGLDKKLTENLSFSIHAVNKSVLWAIEDLGVFVPGLGEMYYYSNPGGNFIKEMYAQARANGLMDPSAPDMPKSKRLYWGLNISIDKRLSDNWLFGFSYTLSRLTGNYSGLANADEGGRNNPNGERSFDLWHLAFDKNMNPIDGPLPTDRPHYIKIFGAYVFPFGLTIGTTMQAMSGTPLTETWNVDAPGWMPYNRGNLGRTPFIYFADAYAEYDLKFGNYTVQFNLNVTNVFNVETVTNYYTQKYRYNITPGEAALASKNWEPAANTTLHPWYMKANAFFPPLQARLGVKFIF